MPVQVDLSNRWARFVNEYPEELSTVFSYRKPGYYFAPAYRDRVWDGRTRMIRRRKIQTGAFIAYRKEAIAKGIDLQIVDSRVRPEFRKGVTSDREYQTDCVDAMIKASRTGGIILNATGSGKTFIAGMYFSKLIGTGCFIVDELTLLDQARKELSKVLGEEVGMVGDRIFEPRRITVATIQTMHLHRERTQFKKWSRKIDVILIDELHTQLNRRNIGTVSALPAKAVFGLTATLQTNRRDIMMRATALAGPVIFEYPLQQGIDEGVLSKGICLGIDLVREIPKSSDIRAYPIQYKKKIVHSRAYNDIIEGLVREGIRRKKYTIVLVENLAHIRILSRRLSDINHDVVCGAVKRQDRKKTIRRVDSGNLRLVITNKVFKKGVNIKRLDLIIDAASKASSDDTKQKYGRGTRLFHSKNGLIYVDVGHKGIVNRFEKSTKRRRRALRKIGVPVYTVRWQNNPEEIVDYAERKLRKFLRRKN